MVIYINGKKVTADSPQNSSISILDRGFLFGDSLYEVVKGTNKKLCFLDQHLERLLQAARTYGYALPCTEAELQTWIEKAVQEVPFSDIYFRMILTRGQIQKFSIDPVYSENPQLIFILMPTEDYLPAATAVRGVRLKVVSVVKSNPQSVPMIKSGNYMNAILAHQEAKKSGADDAILLNAEGYIAEGSTFNVFMIKNGVFYTPSLDCGILNGVTRSVLLSLLRSKNRAVIEKKITLQEWMECNECFICSTMRGVAFVSQINEKEISTGKIGTYTAALKEDFRGLIQTLTAVSDLSTFSTPSNSGQSISSRDSVSFN